MINRWICTLVFFSCALMTQAQENMIAHLKKVMDNYNEMSSYNVDIYTEISYLGAAGEQKEKVGAVKKKGTDFYVKNGRTEIFQWKGKRVEIDPSSHQVIYTPKAEQYASFWGAYEPNWEELEKHLDKIKVTKTKEWTSYELPVGQAQIKSVEYVLSPDNLLQELIYHYDTREEEDIETITVSYQYHSDAHLGVNDFSYEKVLQVSPDGSAHLKGAYQQFNLINTSTYENRN